MIGPLHLLVIGFDEDKYARDIILEIKRLRKGKIIRLFDLLYLFKHQDGTLSFKETSDLEEEEQREFGTVIKSLLGLVAKDVEHLDADEVAESLMSADDEFGVSESELKQLADQIPDGSSAIMVVFEHAWARGFKASIIENGGSVLAQGMISPDTLKETANELATVLEAMEKAESSAVEKMAGVVTEAKSQEEEAMAHAEQVKGEAEAVKVAAVAAIARAEAREKEAAQAIADAKAAEEAALAQAEKVKAETQAMEDDAFAEAEAVRHAAARQQENAIAEAAQVETRARELEAESLKLEAHAKEMEAQAKEMEQRAIETEARAKDMEAQAVLRAIQAMVSSKVIERQMAQDAMNAIIAADVIEARAAREAAAAIRSKN